MDKKAKIYVAGHRGLVGSALIRNLKEQGYANIICRTHAELDLTRQDAVEDFFKSEKPEYVFLAAAKVGGIMANNIRRAEFIYENLMIESNVIHQAYQNGVKKLLFLGSTCIYPQRAPQPMPEDSLLTAPLEYTNEPYAIAKIAGIKMCESYNLQYGTNFISVMPTNLYGPNDNFDLAHSHVMPALLRKMILARALMENNWNDLRSDLDRYPISGVDGKADEDEIKKILAAYGITQDDQKTAVEIWGTGSPMREFLWSDDMADACIYIMKHVNALKPDGKTKEIRNTHINIGTGQDISIAELARMTAKVVGFQGQLVFNPEKPDGTPRKLTDVRKLHALGWKHRVELAEGLSRYLAWYYKSA